MSFKNRKRDARLLRADGLFAPAADSFEPVGSVLVHEAAFNHTNLPTTDQKAALAGTSGSPSNTNRYVTDDDPVFDASYLVLSLSPDLTSERVLTAGAGIGFADAGSGSTLTISNTGVLSITGTANQVIASAGTGAVTLSLPQDIHAGASPTFTGLTLSGLVADSFLYSGTGGLLSTTVAPTDGQLLIGSTGAAPVRSAITGTANRVTVTNGAGSITLSGPQDIHAGATPNFASLSLGVASGTTGVLTMYSILSTFFTALQSGTAAANVTYTLPTNDGSAYQSLKTSGAGILTWGNTPRAQQGANYVIESGTVSLPAGTTTSAISFASAFSATPVVVATIEITGNMQTAAFQALTVNGFTFRRSAAAGAVTGHWIAYGTKA